MVDSNRLLELEERLGARLRTADIGEIAYRVFGSRPTEFEWKCLPYRTYAELFAAMRSGAVEMKVGPEAAYLITDKVAGSVARLMGSLLCICSFATPFVALALAFAGHDWRYALGILGLVGVFLASPHNRSRSCISVIGLVLSVVALFGFPQHWQIITLLLIGPFFFAYAWKGLLIYVAERAVLRSDILIKSLAEDGQLVLRWWESGEVAIPRIKQSSEEKEV